MELIHTQALLKDQGLVFSLLKEAAIWLGSKGINYWQNWLDPPIHHQNWILEGINNQEFFFVYQNNTLLGMYRIMYNDQLFWGNKVDKAGYIHSFTTKREYKGKRIGKIIIQNIEKNLWEKGFDFLRLDCGTEITNLCNYYEQLGFIKTGNIIVDGYKTTLYEKKLG
jgi:ribosomal protein S18 acetylase RimI-like enzyme